MGGYKVALQIMDSDDMMAAPPAFSLKSHLNLPIPLANTGGRPQLSTGWLRVPVARKRSMQFFTRPQGTVFCAYKLG
jgi:hypothetical protein